MILNCQTPKNTCCGILRAISRTLDTSKRHTLLSLWRTFQEAYVASLFKLEKGGPSGHIMSGSELWHFPFSGQSQSNEMYWIPDPTLCSLSPIPLCPEFTKYPTYVVALGMWPNLVLSQWAGLNSDCSVGRRSIERHKGKEGISLSGLQQLVQTCPFMLSSCLLFCFHPCL